MYSYFQKPPGKKKKNTWKFPEILNVYQMTSNCTPFPIRNENVCPHKDMHRNVLSNIHNGQIHQLIKEQLKFGISINRILLSNKRN